KTVSFVGLWSKPEVLSYKRARWQRWVYAGVAVIQMAAGDTTACSTPSVRVASRPVGRIAARGRARCPTADRRPPAGARAALCRSAARYPDDADSTTAPRSRAG